MKEGVTLKDLNCSARIHFNDYPKVSVNIDFKLAIINRGLVDSIECSEYQINGVSNKDLYCSLRFKIYKGEIHNSGTDIIEKVNVLSIEDINVNEEFQRQGIGTKMYQLLSAIYMECYPNYKIKRKFVNPYAEYAFRKAIQENRVDETLLLNSKIERQYNPSQKEILRNLMKKLSEKYRDEV